MHINIVSSTRMAWMLLVCMTAGCATPPPPIDSVGRALDAQLNASARKIDQLLTDIAQAGKAGHIQVSGNRVSVKWQGDAPEVLRRLAEVKGLKFSMIGRPVPIPVSIQLKNSEFVHVLENIGMQLGQQADVVLKTDALEIHYRAL